MKALYIIPIIFFTGFGLFWFADNYIELGILNYKVAAGIVLLLVQLFYNHKIMGLVYGTLLAVFSMYLIVLVFSEYSAEGGFNRGILLRLAIFIVAFLMAASFLYYYIKLKKSK